MDVRMPEMDGIEATRRICSSAFCVPILILTMFDLDAYVFAALRAGATGFLLKDAAPGELLRAVEVVAAGEALLAPRVTRRLIEEFTRVLPPDAVPPAELSALTIREREVLVLIARGLTNAELCERLRVGPTTVKTHIGHLLTKLGVRTRAQLVMVAYESGLVERR
jgi:DNA-binding NarL/FixJ family response regulator